jgi:PAS domain S-box-containing protein
MTGIDDNIPERVKILIVEDSLTQRLHLQHFLEQHPFVVKAAENGKAALALVEVERPDLVISDIVMPEMNGFDLCQQLKTSARFQDIPVILLTSLSNPEDVLEGLACGADNFITKPFKTDILIGQIESVLANKRKVHDERIKIGMEINFMGKKRFVTAEHQQMLTLLLSTYEAAVLRNEDLAKAQEELRVINEQLEELVEQRTVELKKSEEKYLDLYDHAPTMFMSVETTGGTVIQCNDTLLDHTGYTKDEIIGHPFTQRYHPDSLHKATEDFNNFLRTGLVSNSELNLRAKTGKKIIVLCNSTAVRDDQGNIINSRTVLQDITDLKKAQEELRRSMEKAEESDRLKSSFLANMSHEIRTPMNGILGFSQLLKDPDLDKSARDQFIDLIGISTQRLLNIITDIVDISKIESGVEEADLAEVDLSAFISDTEALFQPQADSKNLTFTIQNRITSADSKIKTDKGKLKLIIHNLLSNAVKFTEKGGIEFEVRIEQKKFYCIVKDTGIGIDPQMHTLIFDRFRQVEFGHARKYGGNGLGLSIAKSYAEILKGEITVNSSIGTGSTFTFILPLEIGQAPAVNIQPVSPSDDNSKLNWEDKMILLVEDEEENALFISLALRSTGIKILRAHNGKEAIELSNLHRDISLVLMDIRLPDMDGLTITRQIKSNRPELTIIAVTAYAFAGDREKCTHAGCNEYLTKPLRKDHLLEALKKYLT